MARKLRIEFPERVRRLRERRGWTIGHACSKTRGLKRESLKRLENGQTDPTRVPLHTMMDLIVLYWPHLDLKHFFDDDAELRDYSIVNIKGLE